MQHIPSLSSMPVYCGKTSTYLSRMPAETPSPHDVPTSEKLLCAMSDVDVQSTYDEVLLTYMMYQVYTSDFKLSHMMYVLTHYAWSLYINVRFCARNYVRSCDVCYYRTLMYVKLTLAMYEFHFSKLYDKHTLMYVNTSTTCPFFSNLGDVSRFTHVFVRHKLHSSSHLTRPTKRFTFFLKMCSKLFSQALQSIAQAVRWRHSQFDLLQLVGHWFQSWRWRLQMFDYYT